MNRRDLIKSIGLIAGGTVIGAEGFLAGCTVAENQTGLLTAAQINLLEEIGEFILPKTEKTPGAKEAQIGPLINRLVTAYYPQPDQQVLLIGLSEFKKNNFKKMSPQDRHTYFTQLEKNAKPKKKVEYVFADGTKHKTIPAYTMIKQLCIWSYLSSEIVATTAFSYSPLPASNFNPCVIIDKNTKPKYSKPKSSSVMSFIKPT